MQPITIDNLMAAGFVPYGGQGHLSLSPTETFFPNIHVTAKLNFHLIVGKHEDLRDAMVQIYPESMADIEALKRMLTPK